MVDVYKILFYLSIFCLPTWKGDCLISVDFNELNPKVVFRKQMKARMQLKLTWHNIFFFIKREHAYIKYDVSFRDVRLKIYEEHFNSTKL